MASRASIDGLKLKRYRLRERRSTDHLGFCVGVVDSDGSRKVACR